MSKRFAVSMAAYRKEDGEIEMQHFVHIFDADTDKDAKRMALDALIDHLPHSHGWNNYSATAIEIPET